ncbi:ead/Ea22-like family protein [Citrobacter amalonaticus]|uniref:ead/Ea22-like family protein n=1 Tax=Citrobacter amalonaticus TaxID=35703 RepID=UPI0006225F4E|nr:ead/Ea22-like family protein [Citrobacter amalonaticus]KKF70214.1 hypothetical protein XU19_06060 [Vibrio parahaemolyticus]KKY41815.1 hypothetical protein AAY51_12680 [Vibrio parahaemolyticus]KOP93428.1 hypothetical protein ALC61_21210 [Citrobacter amalonaticus]KOP93922.1 hypothetical protein AL012_17950 [Citrobacter amalonaticus]
MSNIDKRELREAAEKALPAMKRLLMMPNDELFDEALLNVDGDVDAANAFNLLTGPETVLALLDELETKEEQRANWFQMAQKLGEDLDAAEKLNAELNKRNAELTAKIEPMDRRIQELEARAFNPAILDVIAERQRQQSVEGWTPEHDDEHMHCEMAVAAACYIMADDDPRAGVPELWPWPEEWWKPTTIRRDLVKAGALVLAEIERIDRAAGIGKGE